MKNVKFSLLGTALMLLVLFLPVVLSAQNISIDNATQQVQTSANSMKVMFKWLFIIILGAGFLYAGYAYTIESQHIRRANVGLIGAIIVFTIAALMGLISN